MKNVKMGEHVARAVESVPLSHLIYLSTDAVFPEDLPPIDEWAPPSPDNLYGQMAVSREQVMAGVAKASKIPYLILRPCAIYGRGDTHNGYGPNRFVRQAQHEKKIKLFGYGEEMRPHLHIDDLVAVMIESLLLRTSGLLHAIPSPSLSFAEVARTVVECATGEVTLEYIPRSGVPTHKHFIDTQLRYAFPALRRRSFAEEIHRMLSHVTPPNA
jgi:nucleoside-diphosphate-sugar epimerase